MATMSVSPFTASTNASETRTLLQYFWKLGPGHCGNIFGFKGYIWKKNLKSVSCTL
jgi:hypothetical protein